VSAGTPEFSRTVRVDTLGTTPRALSIGANEEERAALAARFGLVGIERLSAQASLTRSGEEIRAAGTLSAAVTQSCVATHVPVPEEVEEAFEILFRPQPQDVSPEEEIELSQGELDVVFYHGASIDMGEAVAETMSLSLDPYPRAPEAETALKQAGVKSEEEVTPVSPLAGLKDLLEGKKS
jgi:uncharacterized metal-binding protein YceD (DUF177 family)